MPILPLDYVDIFKIDYRYIIRFAYYQIKTKHNKNERTSTLKSPEPSQHMRVGVWDPPPQKPSQILGAHGKKAIFDLLNLLLIIVHPCFC